MKLNEPVVSKFRFYTDTNLEGTTENNEYSVCVPLESKSEALALNPTCWVMKKRSNFDCQVSTKI